MISSECEDSLAQSILVAQAGDGRPLAQAIQTCGVPRSLPGLILAVPPRVTVGRDQLAFVLAWHPVDWHGIELTETWMIGIQLNSPDGRAAYQQLQMYTDPGISSQDVVSWGITTLLGNFMGQSADWHVLCQQDSVQSFPIPLAVTLIAATNGQTIVVASASKNPIRRISPLNNPLYPTADRLTDVPR